MNPEPEYAAPPRSADRPAPKKVRYAGIDIIKILALIFVVTVHSFLHTGFYSTPMTVDFGLFQTFFRWAAFCCVPLFMTVTGYLMSRKKLERGFYKGMLRVLAVYVIVSIICVIFNIFYHKYVYTPWAFIRGLFMFTDAQYGWYVEYYLSLYLLIPFINQAYHGMRTRRNKRIMLMTVCFLLLFAQSFFIGTELATQIKPFPNFFTRGYPFAYYLIGAYLRDFPPKPKRNRKLRYFAVYCATLTWTSLVTFYQCRKNTETGGTWRPWHNDDYAAWPVALMTVMLFLMLFDIRIRSKTACAVLKRLSNATFAAYLISYIFDCITYRRLNETYQAVPERFRHVPFAVAKNVFWSMLCGLVIQGGYDLAVLLIRKRKVQKSACRAENQS